MSDSIITTIANRIARHIMECGSEPGEPCSRIQFMTGTWPDNEKPVGGLCESALAALVEEALKQCLKLD